MFTAPLKRLAIALGVLSLVAAATWAAPMQWTLGGYLQARYTQDTGTGNPGTFLANRPSVLIRATDGDHVFLQFFAQKTPSNSSFDVQHAFAEYQAKPHYVRLGLSPLPFGYENPVTSCKLITTERSEVSGQLIGLFALDRGLFYYYMPAEGFNLSAGVVNGETYTTNSDSNNAKNLVARLGYKSGALDAGVSVISGRTPQFESFDGEETILTNSKFDRLGFDAQYATGPLTFVGEIITGKGIFKSGDLVSTANTNGAYLTAAYRVNAFEPYARYELFDPSTDVVNDYFSAVTAGTSYWLNASSKIQGEVEFFDISPNYELQSNDLKTRFVAQYQIVF